MSFSFIIFFLLGASIRAARSTSRHILALESDLKSFEDVLKPLQKVSQSTTFVDLSPTLEALVDDKDALADEQLVNLCE